MEITEKTPLKAILAAYPWLPDVLIGMDSRFQIIRNPIGRLLIRTSSVGDACKKAGYPVEKVLEELNKLIAEHEGSAE